MRPPVPFCEFGRSAASDYLHRKTLISSLVNMWQTCSAQLLCPAGRWRSYWKVESIDVSYCILLAANIQCCSLALRSAHTDKELVFHHLGWEVVRSNKASLYRHGYLSHVTAVVMINKQKASGYWEICLPSCFCLKWCFGGQTSKIFLTCYSLLHIAETVYLPTVRVENGCCLEYM